MAKILIVDDSQTVRNELKDVLEEAGHKVTAGVDGSDGLALAKADTYFDLIISDYNMPGLDGLAMLKMIKELPQYANTPFAMLTTESSKNLKEIGKDTGVIVWFVKPFEKTRLISTIDKVLEKFPPAA